MNVSARWRTLFSLVLSVMFVSQPKSHSLSVVSSSWSRMRGNLPLNHAHRKASPPRRYSRRSSIWMMPEGPEVRTLADQLQPAVGMRLVDIRFLSGRYVTNGPPVGFVEFRKTMTNWRTQEPAGVGEIDVVKEICAKGKFMWLVLDAGRRKLPGIDSDNGTMETFAEINGTDSDDFLRSIWITLGMTGRFLNDGHAQGAASSSSSRWYFEFLNMETGKLRRIYYQDTRNFGTLKLSLSRRALERKLQSLGPDLLGELSEDVFLNVIASQKQTLNICKFLMDQTKISGVGNYLLAEGLYRAKIDPFASVCEINHKQRRSLFRELRDTAKLSYSSQGMSRPGGSYRDVEGKRGKFEFELQCYGRETCARGNPVIRETSGPHGRTIWYVEDQLFVPRETRLAGEVLPAKCSTVEEYYSEARTASSTEQDVLPENTVDELSSRLVESTWTDGLKDFMASSKFEDLANFLASERATGVAVFPPQDEIFTALNLCPLDEVKCVIIGQDPYHGPGQAHGLAFSVRRGVQLPPSLKNIIKEAMNDVQLEPPMHGNLESWAKQGVLLLNTVLTVRSGEANSHAGKGWEAFTDKVIELINERREGVVFLLWGNAASKKGHNVDTSKHVVIQSSHPSPLSAMKTEAPFFGSHCFSRANAALEDMGKGQIDWNVG